MKLDPNRALFGLPQHGAVNEDAIRAAYWRLVGQTGADIAALRDAKRALLFGVGVRTPKSRGRKRKGGGNLDGDPLA